MEYKKSPALPLPIFVSLLTLQAMLLGNACRANFVHKDSYSVMH